MFRLTLLLAAVAVCVWLFCGRDSRPECDTNTAGLRAAAEAGEQAAAAVALTADGSMARENAVIAIRARETAIRDAGFPTAADTFVASAHRRLLADGVLAK